MSTELQTATDHTADVATRPRSTELVIDDGQSDFTPAQLAALQHMGIEDAPEGDRQVFFHQCKRTGLDPFSKQIYMIARAKRKKQGNQWVDDGNTYTIQIGIDGYRVMGNRIATLAGDTLHIGKTEWAGKDGVWRDLWLDPENPPLAARATIVKNGNTIESTAMYHEYVQTKFNGEPNSMWGKMPANQLAKCAEAAAWRKAYPTDFSGLVLEDAAQVVDGQVALTAPARPRVETRRGTAGLADALGVGDDASPGAESTPVAEEPTKDQYTRLAALFKLAGLDGKTAAVKAKRETVTAKLLDRSNFSEEPLTSPEVDKLIGLLDKINNEGPGVLVASVNNLTTETKSAANA